MPKPFTTGAQPVPPRYDDAVAWAGGPRTGPGIGSGTRSGTGRSGSGTGFEGLSTAHSMPASRRCSSTTHSLEEALPALLGEDSCSIAKPTLLQPRVAAVLGVPQLWQKALFVCRLASIASAAWWGLPNGLRFLALLRLLLSDNATRPGSRVEGAEGVEGDVNLQLVETSLATIWCTAAAYLSFFFTDSLMSRWLLNYTPPAAVVRLLAINALNAYLTSWVLYLSGGSEDAHLQLPAWIAIATTLTIIYHITQRKINIRKETRLSISVFSMASYTSMIVLLVHLQSARAAPANVPLRNITRKACQEAGRFAELVLGCGEGTKTEI